MEVERKKELRMKNEIIRKYDGKVSLMKHMFNEIELRACNLEKRCSGSINSWSDSQVFEKRNDIKMIDTEFNETLNNITELVKGTPLEYEEEFGILKTAYKIRNTMRIKKDDYQAELEKEMYDRDLSSEKLQNALLLKIELPKFRGYDSKMDIYTFQNEFDKLISPNIQRKLLPDHLKKNYLEGPVLLLVEEIIDIERIWDKLKESFGSTMLLLQNRLSEVEKYGPIWKIKDENVIQALAKLLNAMGELGELVERHSIEDVLYHPSNLGIIFSLIGDQRRQKFTSKNINVKMNSQEKWVKIIEFLKCELRIKERLVLDERSMHHFKVSEPGYNSKDGEKRYRKSYVSNEETVTNPMKCLICGKDDHVITNTS